jgi:hypothetical protein
MVGRCSLNKESVLASDLGRDVVEGFDVGRAYVTVHPRDLGEPSFGLKKCQRKVIEKNCYLPLQPGAAVPVPFSEKLRLIISSTRSASTRSKFKIMLYVRRNCEISLFGVPSIISVKVDCYPCPHQRSTQKTAAVTHFRQFVASYDDNSSGRIQTSSTGSSSHLGVLSGLQCSEVVAVMLSNVGEDDTLRRHIDAHGECFGRKQDFDETS